MGGMEVSVNPLAAIAPQLDPATQAAKAFNMPVLDPTNLARAPDDPKVTGLRKTETPRPRAAGTPVESLAPSRVLLGE